MERVTGATVASGVPQKPHGRRRFSIVAPSVTVQPPLDSTPKFLHRRSWAGMSSGFAARRCVSNDASFRRLSLDQSPGLQEELGNDNKIAPPSSINEYQNVFQKMKQENPNASVGALRQMTMAKIAELKFAKEQEGARKRSVQQRKDEEERSRNRLPTKKCVDQWVGNMRSNCVDQEHRRKSDPELTTFATPNTANDRGPFKMLRHNSASDLVVSFLLYINVGSVPGGDNQRDNFALRRGMSSIAGSERANSNADTSYDMDDKSIQSFLSEFSDGLFDSTRSSYSRSELSGLRSLLGSITGNTKLVVDDESVGKDDEDIWNKSFEKKICVITDKLLSVEKSSIEILHTRKMSDVSDFTAEYAGASSNGLIVDFTDRSGLQAGLIVGFGQRSRPGIKTRIIP